MDGIVIVGAGHSGGKAAQALRKHGFAGKIMLIGNETHPPYDRPPLSKAVLVGKKTADECFFKPADWYTEQNVDLVLGAHVESIDRVNKVVHLDGGKTVRYSRLLLSMGARANELRIPGIGLDGVSQLRTTLDAVRIAPWLKSNRDLVVVGAGFIGLEVAAAARTLGCNVTIFESASRALARSLPAEVSDRLVMLHLDRGVDVRFISNVAAICGDRTVAGVRLSNGATVCCQGVIYGIGVTPLVELAKSAGLTVRNGIVVGPDLGTNDLNIFACGDVCAFASPHFDEEIRLESWKNAEDQAELVARSMLGQNVSYDEIPWFWSNQYDVTLQVAGLPTLGSSVVERKVGNGSLFFSLTDRKRLVGVCALGPLKDVAPAMRLVKDWIRLRSAFCAEKLASLALPLDAPGRFELEQR